MTEGTTIGDALARADNDPVWLCDQLERWPERVHKDRTTSIRYLDETAWAIISAAWFTGDADLPPPLDRAMVVRMTDALVAFRLQHPRS